jgi:hypothetical protein
MRARLVAIVAAAVTAVAIPSAAKQPHGNADVTTQQNGVPGITAVAEYAFSVGTTSTAGGVPAEDAAGTTTGTITGSGVAVSTGQLAPGAAQSFAPDRGLTGELYPVTFTPCVDPELSGCIPAFLEPPANADPPKGGPKPPEPPPPSPEELAQIAIDRAAAAAAVPELRLAPSSVGLTGLDSYAWLARRPQAIEAVASVPGLTVIAQARPVQYVWDFGDGTTLVTDHPGRPWTLDQPGNIAHLYESRGTYSVGVEIIWNARWQIAGGPWTDLGFFSTSGSRPYPVRQIVARLVPGR